MEQINPSTLQKPIRDFPTQDLSIVVNSNLIPFFFQLMGQGFIVNAPANCSVKELLCSQLGIHEDYLAGRIQTIFLNAKVVDDVNSAIVSEGSTLALSAAMPGLVGAILRSGGFYASMRSQISYDKNISSSPSNAGKITLKFFNLIVKELGPAFLEKGIWIEGEKLQKFLTRNSEELSMRGSLNELNGKPVKINSLMEINWEDKPVILRVTSEKVD